MAERAQPDRESGAVGGSAHPERRLVVRQILGLALVGLAAALGAGIVGYAALRILQDWLGIPEIVTTVCTIGGALLGCQLAFRFLPPSLRR